jgi:hypothetical protein
MYSMNDIVVVNGNVNAIILNPPILPCLSSEMSPR